MPQNTPLSIAIVSHWQHPEIKTIERLRDLIQDSTPRPVRISSFTEDREGLSQRGSESEIVYGNVRRTEFAALSQLRWIHATWTGIENLLYPEVIASPVILTNTRGQNALPMAEHALASLLYLARDFPTHLAADSKRIWRPRETQARLLAGSRVLILGTGEIASILIPKLIALDLIPIAVNTNARPVAGCAESYTLESVRSQLQRINFVISLLPAARSTKQSIDESFLASLAPGAGVINLSRGSVLDEATLIRQIDRGQLCGAVLDVTDPEPPHRRSPLYKHPRILLTGHKSWQPSGTTHRAAETFLENIPHYINGRFTEMQSLVDKVAGY